MMADRALGLVTMVCGAVLYLHCCSPFILPGLLSSCLLFNCVFVCVAGNIFQSLSSFLGAFVVGGL
jgi:hypothetical protein